MPIFFLRSVVTLLCFVLVATSSGQQTSARLSKGALEVKRKANQLLPQAPISVIRLGADERFGRFVSRDEERFTFYDIDQKENVTLQYESVKKIKDGYGGYNHLNHRHVDRRRNLIVVAVVVGGLAALIGAAVALR